MREEACLQHPYLQWRIFSPKNLTLLLLGLLIFVRFLLTLSPSLTYVNFQFSLCFNSPSPLLFTDHLLLLLLQLPTPIHRWNLPGLPNGTELWIKRDDFTGMELSGNKVRKLEFLMAEAVDQHADTVITIGGIQSNHCRATATASNYLNLNSHLILRTSKVSLLILHLTSIHLPFREFMFMCVWCVCSFLLMKILDWLGISLSSVSLELMFI